LKREKNDRRGTTGVLRVGLFNGRAGDACHPLRIPLLPT
jgi:hypothetical protein